MLLLVTIGTQFTESLGLARFVSYRIKLKLLSPEGRIKCDIPYRHEVLLCFKIVLGLEHMAR